MSRVAVKPELLRWARERSELSTNELTQRFPKYEQWERGEAHPTLRQLEDLAKKTLTPLGYFFLPQPPEDKLPIPDFRTVSDTRVRRPSPNLLETIHMMQRRQAWMHDFLAEEGEPLPFVGSMQLSNEPAYVAQAIRDVLRIGDAWAEQHDTWSDALRALRYAVEDSAILVVINGVVGNNPHRKLDPNEFRGFVLSDPYAPLIFINGADAKAAQMFTMAHELAHVWLGHDGVFDLQALQPADNDIEKFCNAVAAEFLVPEQELRNCWPETRPMTEPFQALARRFKISPLVAARRALDLRLISRSVFFDFYERYQADERRKAAKKAAGGDFYATQDVRLGRRFARAVIFAAREGRLLYRDAYHLTGLHGQTFDRYAESLGFAPQA